MKQEVACFFPIRKCEKCLLMFERGVPRCWILRYPTNNAARRVPTFLHFTGICTTFNLRLKILTLGKTQIRFGFSFA